jgi:UDP:flavonoid glycosyltransferase YjiC (YdhE family)
MGYRVANGGVGVWLDKLTFTSSQVSHHINELLTDTNGHIAQSLTRLGDTLRLAGGVQRAADLLQHTALVG